jgi:hypothetical protein
MLEKLYRAIRADAAAQELTIYGRKYTTEKVQPVEEPEPKTLEVSTLTGLVDYLKNNIDTLNLATLLCHVESPTRVSVVSNLHGDFQQRNAYIQANARVRGLEFNKFMDAEKFNLYLQSCFVETPITVDGEVRATDKGLILKYVGNIKESMVKETGDDGISQEMTVKVGLASVENVTLPNPAVLRPYRTFNEVPQPASAFVFRAHVGPEFALIEADNGAWESEAMKSIKEFMEFEVPGLHVIA